MLTPEGIERFNQDKYEKDYSLDQVSINKGLDKKDYFQRLVEIKLSLIKKYGFNKRVLDVGCGSGDYLLKLSDLLSAGVGVDFTQKAIDEANVKKSKQAVKNIDFLKGNARSLSFDSESFDLAFSFSSLFYMPKIEEVVREMWRVAKPGGIIILEMGNLQSLNTVVCKAYPEWAQSCHISTNQMKRVISQSELKVLQWRSFQIFPLWGERPRWLKPLLHPRWKKFFQKEIKGKMLDEWISNLPLIKHFAFRHIIVCQK